MTSREGRWPYLLGWAGAYLAGAVERQTLPRPFSSGEEVARTNEYFFF